MTYRRPPRRIRIRWLRVAGLLVAVVAIAVALGDRLPASSSSTAASSSTPTPPRSEPSHPRREHRDKADGGLDPALLEALRQATTDAAYDGVEIRVESGWRSPEYQEQLLREAVSKYGSEAEAARWVATAETSPHVSGDAIDIAPLAATAWLSEHGAEYGLCQIYGNEPWHYELRPEAIGDGCPPMYPDPTYDPRMQR